MTSIQPFWVYSTSEIQRIEKHLQKVIADWSGQWMPAGQASVQSVANSFERPVMINDACWYLGASDVQVILADWQALAAGLLSLDDSEHIANDESVRHLLMDAVSALVNAVTESTIAIDYADECKSTFDVYGAGGLSAHFTVAGAELIFLLSSSAIQHCLKAGSKDAATNITPLKRRRDAIGESTLSLSAVLGDVELSIGDLSTLQKGDVLSFPVAADSAVKLVNESGVVVCRGALGEHQGKRSLQIVSKSSD